MKRFILLAALLSAGVAQAEANGFCKPVCDTDKRECRSDAASASDEDTQPLLAMADRNPNARVARGLADKPLAAQSAQAYESRRVKLQRACDTQYLRCVQACTRDDRQAAPPVNAK